MLPHVLSKSLAQPAGALVLSLHCLACAGAGPRRPPPVEHAKPVPPQEIGTLLRDLPGVSEVEEHHSPKAFLRVFRGRFDQPVDHARPEGPRFTQRFQLTYRSRQAPMVVVLESAALPGPSALVEPTQLLEGNQLLLEQRFAGSSVPDAD